MGARDEYVSGIKKLFVDLGTKAFMGFLVAEVPIFASPILNYIASHIVNMILVKLTDIAEMQIFFLYIDFRVNKQGTDFYEAVTANEKAKKNGTAKEKADAEKNLIDRFREFAKLTN